MSWILKLSSWAKFQDFLQTRQKGSGIPSWSPSFKMAIKPTAENKRQSKLEGHLCYKKQTQPGSITAANRTPRGNLQLLAPVQKATVDTVATPTILERVSSDPFVLF